jgi:threonine dehydratase
MRDSSATPPKERSARASASQGRGQGESRSDGLTLAAIFAARQRIAPYIRRTPLVRSEALSSGADGPVWLKLESQQVTYAFKARGAFNAAVALREAADARPSSAPAPLPRLVAASSGNHGRALSYAAKLLGFSCTVFAPASTPKTKLDAIRANGAELVTSAGDFDTAEAAAKQLAASAGDAAVYVSPYNDAHIVAATGTIGVELFEDQPRLDTIIVPLGGGGLIGGIAAAAKAIHPSVRVIGVEAAANPAFHTARRQGRPTPIDPRPTLADGVSGNFEPDSITVDLVDRFVDDIVLVEEADIARAIRHLAVHEHLIAEGAAALGVAALATGAVRNRTQTAVIISGANIDGERLASILGAGNRQQP